MYRLLQFLVVLLTVLGGAYDSRADLYAPPPGGYAYTYEANPGQDAAGTGTAFDALDGTFSHDNGADEWDGTGAGMGRPGGASIVGGALRIQDTGDPRDYGMGDPGSNRKIYLGHDLVPNGAGATLLDSGVTLHFRARIPTDDPLDSLHPDGGGGIVPYPAGGDGYRIHDGGKGNISLRQSAGGLISFSLSLAGDEAGAELAMNSLNGNAISADVDTGEGTAKGVPLDATAWHEYWITIGAGGAGTHQVTVYLDGSLTPVGTFDVTAGNGSDFSTTYLAIGVGSTPSSGAVDIDFVRVAFSEHAPPGPTHTPTQTPTSTPTATPTTTSTATPTNTPAPDGDACIDPADCLSGNCVDDVCCDATCDGPMEQCNVQGRVGTCTSLTSPVPTTSGWGLLISLGILVTIATFALVRRRALKHYP